MQKEEAPQAQHSQLYHTYLSPSVACKQLIKDSEGCRLRTYRDAVGVLTIGYGHTGSDVRLNQQITQDMANVLLEKDMKKAAGDVLRLTNNRCSQGQLDALTSFVFNLGAGRLQQSSLLRYHNAGRYNDAANEFCRWVHAGKKVLPGLVKRRKKEEALYRA